MPDFVRNILISITGYGWIALLAGLGLFGYAAYSNYKASDDHAFAQRDKLTSVSGHVAEVSEVTVTSRRRRGGSRVSDRYYEATVKPASGEAMKLRMSLSVGEKTARSIIDEDIAALYDADDNNIAYDISMGGKTLLAYETTKARLQTIAEAEAKSIGGWLTFMAAIGITALGAALMYLNGRLKRDDQAVAA